jgi:hypothetical protein
MKYRDSGMPNEEMWINFFNPSEILKEMVTASIHCGTGYVRMMPVPCSKPA